MKSPKNQKFITVGEEVMATVTFPHYAVFVFSGTIRPSSAAIFSPSKQKGFQRSQEGDSHPKIVTATLSSASSKRFSFNFFRAIENSQ